MKNIQPIAKQTGAVLFISLILLLIMTLLGITGMQSTILEEKMASNYRDKNVAFQAAEAALRNAESDIRSTRISGVSDMNGTCTNGLCYNAGNDIQNIWDDAAKVANAVIYGVQVSAPNILGVSAQPKYLIVGRLYSAPGAAKQKFAYTITAIAEGGSSTTRSILQSIYIPS